MRFTHAEHSRGANGPQKSENELNPLAHINYLPPKKAKPIKPLK